MAGQGASLSPHVAEVSQLPAAGRPAVSVLELTIAASSLPSPGMLGFADPYVALFHRLGSNTSWQLLGKTEVLQRSTHPQFTSKFVVPYYFEEARLRRRAWAARRKLAPSSARRPCLLTG